MCVYAYVCECNMLTYVEDNAFKYSYTCTHIGCMHIVHIYSATANESLKLMLVGLQKQGKTTLLSRLTEMNEVEHLASTYSSRMSGDPTASSYGQRPTRNASGKYMLLPIFICFGWICCMLR